MDITFVVILIILLAGVVALLPLILSIIAIGNGRRLSAEVEKLRREVFFLQSERPAPSPKAAGTPARAAAVSPVPASAPAPAPAPAPIHAPPPIFDERRADAFARLTQQLPPLVAGPAPEIAPQEELEPTPMPRPTETYSGIPLAADPTPLPRPVPRRPKAPAIPLEQRLIRIAVWVGGIAFALAGIFLVKVAFDRNYITPPIRVSIGAAFGLVLIGVGLWRDKHERAIGQSLSAAGIAVLFASFLAATNYFHLLPPLVGFALLAGTTALAVVLSLKQGPFIALLGLIGGFITPALIRTDHPSALNLFGYLFLLHVGLILTTRARAWPALAVITVLASQVWVVIWLITQRIVPGDAQILGVFVLLSALAAVASTLTLPAGTNQRVAAPLAYLAMILGIVLSGVLLGASDFSSGEWVYIALLSAACLGLARIRPLYEPLAAIAAIFVFFLLAEGGQHPRDFAAFRMIVIAFAAGFSLIPYGLLWKSRSPLRWGMLSLLAAIAFTLLAYILLDEDPRPAAWGIVPLAVAALYTLLALPFYRRRATMAQAEDLLETFAAGILVLIAVALPMAYEQATLTATLAALAPCAALAALRLRLKSPDTVALLLGLVVGIRLILNPAVVFYPTGPSLYWNPLVWGYLPSIAALALTVYITTRDRPCPPAHTLDRFRNAAILETIAAFAVVPFLALYAHLIFHPESLKSLLVPIGERALLPNLLLPAALLMFAIAFPLQRTALRAVAAFTLIAAALFVVAINVLLFSPLWTTDDLGPKLVVNLLWPLYAFPAIMLAIAAVWLRRRPGSDELAAPVASFATVVALLLLFVFVSLEVRYAFIGPVLDSNLHFASTGPERATYPLLWLVIAAALLFFGRSLHLSALAIGGYLFAFAAVAFVLIISTFAFNPLVNGESVGAGLLNQLLLIYLAPCAFLGALAIGLFRSAAAGEAGNPDRLVARTFAITAILVLFVYVSLQVRQSFAGPILTLLERPSSGEMYAYSAAWAVLGTALLIAGIATKGPTLRWASLAVMLLTIVKVFLFDTANLSDLFRVLSFAGLGVALILLALLYHHFVFPRPVKIAAPG